MFKLHSIQEQTAIKNMNCDAATILFGVLNNLEGMKKIKHLTFLVYNKPLQILKNNHYLQIEVFDTDSGEILEFNCLKHIHHYCIAKRIYPDYLLNIFK